MAERAASATPATGGGETVELLRALVRAPSPNPPGDEREVVEVVRAFLAGAPAVEVEEVGVDARRPMLVATARASRPGRTLIFAGHVDTVPVADGWTRDPFGADVAGGRLYGLGASDMKSGVAGFLVALKQLAELRDQWCGEVVAHVVPDEEPGGQLGTQILLERGLLRGDAAVVAEPSELCVYRAQKGNVFARARFEGRSAHGSTPELGRNAILRAVQAVVRLEHDLARRLAERRHELVGPATLNIGTISGGRRTNMVPDECIVTIDRRLVPGERTEDAVAELEAFLDGEGELTYEHVGVPFETPARHWLVGAATAVVDEAHGEQQPVGGLVGSSDARFYAGSAGIPTIILGPGSMSQAHAPDESVDLRLVEMSADVYRNLALRALAPDPQ